MPLYQNKSLICKDCGSPFDFSARDQMFYAEKGFENEPQRCRQCRTARKEQRAGEGTSVPFRPRGDRPVYCRSCYTALNAVRA
jgi:CxxC-x17-CxxC domain-containing protein